jgi:hypothetical protein
MGRRRFAGSTARVCRAVAVGAVLAALAALDVGTASADSTVSTEATLRAAFADPNETQITLTADIDLADCTEGDLDRNSTVALTVIGQGSRIRQLCAGRVMTTAGGGALTLQQVTVTGGNLDTGASAATGGGIFAAGALTLDRVVLTGNRARDDFGGLAGGAFAVGLLTVTRSVVSDNTAATSGSFGGLGGALVANGGIMITDSTLSGNVAEGGTTFGGSAGAIFTNAGDVTVVRSTVSGNRAKAGGTPANGGGIAINADLTLVSSTVTGNIAEGAGSSLGGVGAGGLLTLFASTVVENSAGSSGANVGQADAVFGSVIALPRGGAPNCAQPAVTSDGHNFSDDLSCGLTAAGDRQGAGDPLLGPLAANGGPTSTRLPQPGSPLLDAIPEASCQPGGPSL